MINVLLDATLISHPVINPRTASVNTEIASRHFKLPEPLFSRG
jgi:hypothetical protein